MTATRLIDWPRDRYRPGGADPWLFYVVYGPLAGGNTLSSSQYRSAGIPDGVQMSSYTASAHPEVLDSFRQGYLWDKFRKQHPALAQRVAQASECLEIGRSANHGNRLGR